MRVWRRLKRSACLWLNLLWHKQIEWHVIPFQRQQVLINKTSGFLWLSLLSFHRLSFLYKIDIWKSFQRSLLHNISVILKVSEMQWAGSSITDMAQSSTSVESCRDSGSKGWQTVGKRVTLSIWELKRIWETKCCIEINWKRVIY